MSEKKLPQYHPSQSNTAEISRPHFPFDNKGKRSFFYKFFYTLPGLKPGVIFFFRKKKYENSENLQISYLLEFFTSIEKQAFFTLFDGSLLLF